MSFTYDKIPRRPHSSRSALMEIIGTITNDSGPSIERGLGAGSERRRIPRKKVCGSQSLRASRPAAVAAPNQISGCRANFSFSGKLTIVAQKQLCFVVFVDVQSRHEVQAFDLVEVMQPDRLAGFLVDQVELMSITDADHVVGARPRAVHESTDDRRLADVQFLKESP